MKRVYAHECYLAYSCLGLREDQWVRSDNYRDDGRLRGVAVEGVDLYSLVLAYYSDP